MLLIPTFTLSIYTFSKSPLFNVFHYCFFSFKGTCDLLIDIIPVSINRVNNHFCFL